jgi:hypothetical protein
VENSEVVHIEQFAHDSLKGRGKFMVIPEWSVLHAPSMEDTVEVLTIIVGKARCCVSADNGEKSPRLPIP